MIPVGTLCEIVYDLNHCPSCATLNGRFCTVTGPSFTRDDRRFANGAFVTAFPVDIHMPHNLTSVRIEHLRPIVPPGDPDKIDTREPEKVEA